VPAMSHSEHLMRDVGNIVQPRVAGLGSAKDFLDSQHLKRQVEGMLHFGLASAFGQRLRATAALLPSP
jgi:hypothetical protein